MIETVSMAEILKMASKSALNDAHTMVVATVKSYDVNNVCADLTPVCMVGRRNPDNWDIEFVRAPELPDVPVAFPARLTWPVRTGDPGIVVFSERSMEEYLDTGATGAEPGDLRRFDWSDGVFYPCFLRGESDADPSSTVLSTAAGNLKIRSSPSALTRPVALDPPVVQYLTTQINNISTWAAQVTAWSAQVSAWGSGVVQAAPAVPLIPPLIATAPVLPVAPVLNPPAPSEFASSNVEAE